jgi:hypothetical protein
MLATQLATGGKVHVLPDELVRSARIGLAAPMAGGYAMKSLATLRKRLGADYVLSGSYFVCAGGDAKLRLDLALQDARGGTAKAVVQNGAWRLADAGRQGRRRAVRESWLRAGERDDARRIDKALPPSTEVARRTGNAPDAMRRHDPARAKAELLQAIAPSPGYAGVFALIRGLGIARYDAWHWRWQSRRRRIAKTCPSPNSCASNARCSSARRNDARARAGSTTRCARSG